MLSVLAYRLLIITCVTITEGAVHGALALPDFSDLHEIATLKMHCIFMSS